MLTQVKAGDYRVRGVSVGGVYTSIHVPQLGALFDVGLPMRSAAGVKNLFLSHGHVDHSGGLMGLLGIRALVGGPPTLRLFLPAEIVDHVRASLESYTLMQRWRLDATLVPMAPGDVAPIKGDLSVRAFRTLHPVPSLGYALVRTIKKLKAEYTGLPGIEVRELRQQGVDMFDVVERTELAYVTDSLVEVLDREPAALTARTLILECTFLDDRKSLAATRAGCHIHLDELLERAHAFENESIVLMHFSQLYSPRDVEAILDARCPPELRQKIVALVPGGNHWWG